MKAVTHGSDERTTLELPDGDSIIVGGKGFQYVAVLRRPLSLLRPGRLLGCTQAEWDAAFTEWSVLQLWFSVLLVALGELLVVAHDGADRVPYTALDIAMYGEVSYLNAHLG